MSMLKERDKEEIKKRFAELKNPVKLINFTQTLECMYCNETRALIEEVGELSEFIDVQVYNFIEDKAMAEKFGIDKIPATIVMGEKDYGIRLYGIPSGYEFSTLLEDIIMVSNKESGLAPETKQKLAEIKDPLHLQVFVTPTCPYCPSAVLLAHKFAMENDNITGDMVEATEFPHLANKYSVMGVPKTVANDKDAAEGAVPEQYLLDRVLNLAA